MNRQPAQPLDFPLGTRDRRRWWALLLVASLTVMSSAVISPSLPQLALAFQDIPEAVFLAKLTMTMPALFIAVCAPLAGMVVDRFGRTRFLYACMVLYGLSGTAGYLLNDLHAILVSRAFLGVAVAGSMTSMSTLAGDYFAGQVRVRFASAQAIFMSTGGAVFIGLGGILADIHWRLPFLLYGVAWLVLIVAWRWLDEPPSHRDVPGQKAPVEPVSWASVAFVYSMVFTCVTMFYMTMVQMSFLLRQMNVWGGAEGIGKATGLVIVCFMMTSVLGSMRYPRLRARFGFLGIYILSFLIMATGYVLIGSAHSYAAVLAGAILAGSGAGLFFPNGSLWIFALAPAAMRGRLSGGLASAIFLGQFASPLMLQPVIALVGLPHAYLLSSVFMYCLAALLWILRHRLAQSPLPGFNF